MFDVVQKSSLNPDLISAHREWHRGFVAMRNGSRMYQQGTQEPSFLYQQVCCFGGSRGEVDEVGSFRKTVDDGENGGFTLRGRQAHDKVQRPGLTGDLQRLQETWWWSISALTPGACGTGWGVFPGVSLQRWPPGVPLKESDGAVNYRLTSKLGFMSTLEDGGAGCWGDRWQWLRCPPLGSGSKTNHRRIWSLICQVTSPTLQVEGSIRAGPSDSSSEAIRHLIWRYGSLDSG